MNFDELLEHMRLLKKNKLLSSVAQKTDSELGITLGLVGGNGQMTPAEIASVRKAVSLTLEYYK